MKKTILLTITLVAIVMVGCSSTKVSSTDTVHPNLNGQRDYIWENYCDSIYNNDPDTYLDVLMETDDYQEYLDIHGEWWED